MAWYPTINGSEELDMYGIVHQANLISNNVLMPVILLTIFLISLMGFVFSGKSFFRGLTYSGFFCSILSILMVIMNMLNNSYMYFAFFITAVGLIGVRLSEAPS